MHKWVKHLLVCALIVCAGNAYAQMGTDNTILGRSGGISSGWHIAVTDTALGTSYGIVALDAAYAVLGGLDSIEVVGADGDSGRVRIVGLGPDTTRLMNFVRFTGNDTVKTDSSFILIESVQIDSIDNGDLDSELNFIKGSSDHPFTHLTQIGIGLLDDYAAIKLIDRRAKSYLVGAEVENLSAIGYAYVQIRFYPDPLSLRSGNNYVILKTFGVPPGQARSYIWTAPVMLQRYLMQNVGSSFSQAKTGALAVYAKSTVANTALSVILNGYDNR